MTTRLNRLLGKSTLAKDVIAERQVQAEAKAAEEALLEQARQEEIDSQPLDEALEDDVAKLVKRLSNSNVNSLKSAAKAAKEMGDDLANPMSERPVWKAVSSMLKTISK